MSEKVEWKVLPNLSQYQQKFHRPFWQILLISLLVALTLLLILSLPFEPIRRLELWNQGYRKPLFVYYISLYIGMWITYYLSAMYGDKWRLFNVQSLRRILRSCSYQWKNAVLELVNSDHSKPDSESSAKLYKEFDENFESKSKSVITSVAILMAASLLALNQINDIYLSLRAMPPEDLYWSELCVGLAAILAVSSFLCFILSVDDLDTIFNTFKNKDENILLVHFFFRRASNPKYYGFTFLVLSIIFITGFHSLTLGSVVAGLGFFHLYMHLYPKISDDGQPIPGYYKTRMSIVAFPIIFDILSAFI